LLSTVPRRPPRVTKLRAIMAEFLLAALCAWLVPWALARGLLRQWTPHGAGQRPQAYFNFRVWFFTSTVACCMAGALRCFPAAEPTIVVWAGFAALSQPWHLRHARCRREVDVAYQRLLARFRCGESLR
jgi:hypothetical protein